MLDLNSYLPKAEEIATFIDDFMMDELHLMPPATYELNARGERVYLIGSYNGQLMGKSLRVYEHPDIARRLKMSLGLPVTITKQTGTRYVVLLHGSMSLPKAVRFPGLSSISNEFRLGVGLRGEIKMHASKMLNVMIGASQGAGKSNILELLAGQMMAFGWQLYLADPQYHTFNPDLWNTRAEMVVAGSHDDLYKVLSVIENELATRVHMFRNAAHMGVVPADIEDYNANPSNEIKMPRLGLLIDEANFFLANKSIFARLADLLRQGRKWGIHIVIAAHEWHKDSIPASVNDLLQTRIALSSLSGAVVLRSHSWGKWTEGKPAGRGVLRTNKFEPIQFYLVAEETPAKLEPAAEMAPSKKPCPIPAQEAELVRRAIAEASGKMTMDLLTQWGLSQDEARDLGSRYEALGWLIKDPKRGNARFVADELIAIIDEFFPQTHKPHKPTNQGTDGPQTPQTQPQTPQTADSVAA